MTHPLASMNNAQLISRMRELAQSSFACEAELVLHLGEVEARKLYLEDARATVFDWCRDKLNFSEDVAYNRLAVARLARRLPVVVDYLRDGRIHLTGLRLLSVVLNEDNCVQVLEEAVLKSKAHIEELCARLSPKPSVPDSIRKLPTRAKAIEAQSVEEQTLCLLSSPAASDVAALSSVFFLAPSRPAPKPVQPLAEDAFRVQFTASRQLRDKLKKLQDLMSHSVPDGDLATLLEAAVDVLTQKVEKERFATGRARAREKAPGPAALTASSVSASRHIPNAIKRQVRERDGNRCTFHSPNGERCPETAFLQFDHLDGWARTRQHSVERLALKCRAHNLAAAEQMYGVQVIQQFRTRWSPFQNGEEGLYAAGAQPNRAAS